MEAVTYYGLQIILSCSWLEMWLYNLKQENKDYEN